MGVREHGKRLRGGSDRKGNSQVALNFSVQSISPRIIAEIFSNCLEHHVRMSSGNAPLLLCRVSSSWRELALTIPQLWASINMSLRHSNDVDPSTCAHIANAWLERSGTLPLTVAIGYFGRTKSPVLDAVLSIVCSYSSRWQNVAINSWVPVSFPQLGSLPLLRSFHLRASNSSLIIGFPFSRCPRLTQLSWPYPLDPLTHTQILGNQLSHVCLPGMSAIAALETIRVALGKYSRTSGAIVRFSFRKTPPGRRLIILHCRDVKMIVL